LISVRNEDPDDFIEPEILYQTEGMICAQIMPKTKYEQQLANLVNKNIGNFWQTIREKYSNQYLESMPDWLNTTKLNDNSPINDQLNIVDLSNLNKQQKFTYDIVKKFKDEKKQLLMILLGTAGTGKSFTVAAISEFKKKKLKDPHLLPKLLT